MFEDLFKNRKAETQTIPKETLGLGLFPIESKTTTQAIIEPTGEEPLGLVGPLAVGKQIQEAIARSGASVVLTATRQKQLTSEELRPGFEKTFKEVIFGKEPLKPIEQRVAETEISLAREGLPIVGKPELVKGKEKFLAPIGVLGTIALDFTGWGGGKGQVLKLLAKTNKVEEVANILRKIGVAEDLIGDYSKVIAETTKVDDVAKALNRIEEIQKTTKVAPKIAPEAQKGLPEVIPAEKGIFYGTKDISAVSRIEIPKIKPQELDIKKLIQDGRLSDYGQGFKTEQEALTTAQKIASSNVPNTEFFTTAKNYQGKSGYRILIGDTRNIEVNKYIKTKGIIPQELESALIKEAKVFGRTKEEFISKVRGGSTQYGEYNANLRKYGTSPESARISDLGVNPEREITIYRGIDDLSGKARRTIIDGDFVTTDFESALTYTDSPKNVVSKKVKAKDLIKQFASDFDSKDPFFTGAEFVYSDSKNPLIKLSNAQLTDFYTQAVKGVEPIKEFLPVAKSKQNLKFFSQDELKANIQQIIEAEERQKLIYGKNWEARSQDLIEARERFRSELVGRPLEVRVAGEKVRIAEDFEAVKGVKEVSIPARPSSRLGQIQAAPGEVSFRPGQPTRPTKTQPELPRQATKILKSDSLSTQYHKIGEESSVIREVDKSLTPGALDIQKGGLYSSFKNSIENMWTNVREFIQDDWYRVKKLVDNKNWTMEGLDPYQREILFRGRVGARLEEVVDEIVRIDRQIINSSKSLGIKDNDLLEEINSYLISKHAPERNLRLGEGAAGITTKEANETLGILKESPHFDTIEKISKQISDLNKKTLEVLKEGQVIDKETYDLLNKTYKNHVPLNRVFEENEDIVQVLINKGLDVKWSGLRRAVGSERKVSDILTNVAMNYEQAIVRAEKNLVDLSTLKFARQNNYMGGLFSEIKPRAIGKTFDDKIILEKITDPSVLALRENGKAVYLKINDPHLAIALKGINRYKVDGIMRGVQAITRWFASLATRFNPEFAIPNKIRDLQEAIVYAASKKEIGLRGAPKLVARDLGSQKDILDYLRGADTEGAKLYKQMKMDGGTTGGMALSTRQQLEIDIVKIRKINRSNPRKVANEIINKVEQWNMLFEDSTRLSIYKEALTRGATRERAAVLAKEGTINFNKMGRGGPVINSLYMFSNASIQGSAKMLMAMRNPKVASVVVGSVGVAVASTGEWNDRVDPDWRDKVSKWDRMNGLPIVIPSTDEKFNYITIPVSWGIKPIKVSMDYFYDLASGKAENLEEVASGIFASFMEAYNPIGGTDFTSAITPTVLDLPVDLARNKKWSGSKMRPDYSAYTPDSLNYFDSLKETSTGKFFVEMTDKISENTGGRIEISPADANYAYQQIIGGTGRFVSKSINTILSVKDQKLSSKEIPFVSRFYRSIPAEETGKAGKASEEIRKLLTEQSRERIKKTQEAEAYYEELKKMPREQAKEVFDELIKKDKNLAQKINDIISEEKLGLTYTERLIKQFGVDNGERAKFLFNQFNQLKTQKEKKEYYQNLIDKKIITNQVGKQLEFLLNQ